jgi:hypothetical protein
MRHLIFFGLALLLASPILAQRPPAEVRAERCKVAIAYASALLTQLHDRVVFTNEGEQAYSKLNKGGWFSENGSLSASPPNNLLRLANREGRTDALSLCPSMATEIRKVAYDRTVVITGSNIDVNRTASSVSRRIIVSITLPVVSTNKKSAILFSSQVSGPLAGGVYAYYMRYSSKKGWVVASSKRLAVA